MESLIQKLLTIPSSYIVIALITFFYTLESLQDSQGKFKDRINHFFNNLLLYIAVIIFSYLFALLQVFCVQWLSDHQLGLFHIVHIPLIPRIIIGIVCFDLTMYWFHRLSHTYRFLWSLHRVHHSDTRMDTSTFFRHHPLEAFVTIASTLTACFIFGLDINILGVYVFIAMPWMIVQHSNLKFPPLFDKVFGKILATPNFHKLHHSQDQVYTDSNFADIFIIWDKLFGTFQPYQSNDIAYGLEEFKEDKKQDFWFLIKSPFIKVDE